MKNQNGLCFLTLSLLWTWATAFAETADDWRQRGARALKDAKQVTRNQQRAKNVILFVGDGMGVSTVTAARIFAGQQRGGDGEGYQLSFEKFPYLAMSKTYSANQQTPDSAPTMTAMVTGVKTNDGVLSVDQAISHGERNLDQVEKHRLQTILELAESNHLATGVISTARVTHATPAATYAHTSHRDWEADANLPETTKIKDIALQLLENPLGNGIEVVMGGGRTKFLPNNEHDPEYPELMGERKDGRHLVNEYVKKYQATYLWNNAQLKAVQPKKSTKLIGLFEPSHMHHDYDRANDSAGEPSLAEMTSIAIDVLKQNPNGFLLIVEGGLIDVAHHAGNAFRALSDTMALSDAVDVAMKKTNSQDTLVIVTADHSHTLTIAGYPKRGNPILGKVVYPGQDKPALAADGLPYATLTYANGRGTAGADSQVSVSGKVSGDLAENTRRKDLTPVDTTEPNFHQEALVPLAAETHGAEDVQIFASGPQAHLFHGIQEQNFIFYVMKEALGFK